MAARVSSSRQELKKRGVNLFLALAHGRRRGPSVTVSVWRSKGRTERSTGWMARGRWDHDVETRSARALLTRPSPPADLVPSKFALFLTFVPRMAGGADTSDSIMAWTTRIFDLDSGDLHEGLAIAEESVYSRPSGELFSGSRGSRSRVPHSGLLRLPQLPSDGVRDKRCVADSNHRRSLCRAAQYIWAVLINPRPPPSRSSGTGSHDRYTVVVILHDIFDFVSITMTRHKHDESPMSTTENGIPNNGIDQNFGRLRAPNQKIILRHE